MIYLVSKNGHHILVDSDDYRRYKHISWFTGHYGYALGYDRTTGKNVALHRLIMNAAKGECVDHINRDKLDCRKANLRIATRTQNNRNIGLSRNNVSGYKGVFRVNRRWRAVIWVDSKPIHLGYFDRPIDAAQAYNAAAADLHGEFACLNEIGVS